MRKFIVRFFLFFLLIFGSITLLNAAFFLRAYSHYQEGTFSLEAFRLDLASYNIGQPERPIPYTSRVSKKDGMVQIRVPEGEFLMGNGDGGNSPEHLVYLDSFWLDRYEVTNEMYLKCMNEGGCTDPATVNTLYDKWVYRHHPIVYITWYEANDYCEWAERRLPTEAEWEKAARGTDMRPYPWGFNEPSARLSNFDQSMINESVSVFRYPVGASAYGALNMAGNTREWVADWFDPKYYYDSPNVNPVGPETGKQKSLRGGSYSDGDLEITVYRRYRHDPESPGLNRGFRCAQSQ